MEAVSFTKMEDGNAEEYAFLTPLYNNCLNSVPDTLLKILKQMQGDKLGYKIDRYTPFSTIGNKSRKGWRR